MELARRRGKFKLREAMARKSVVVFYNVKAVVLAELTPSIVSILITAAVCRTISSMEIALLDLAMYRKVTGRPFDRE